MSLVKLPLAAAVCAVLSVCAFGQQQPGQVQGQVIFKTPQEAVKYYEDLVGGVVIQMRSLQDEHAKAVNAINELQRQVQALSQSNQSLSQELAAIKKQFASDSEARQAQMSRIVERAVKETATAVKSSEPAASGPDVECIEYTVQKGATLSAIAKAYGVSVEDIKKVNKMGGDMVREGQKLLIPKK